MKDNIIQILKLFLVCVISAAVLALVFGVTKDPIEKSKAAEVIKAVKAVTDGFTDEMTIKDTMIVHESGEFETYIVMNGDNPAGYAIKTYSGQGYGGTVSFMVGTDTDMNITGLYILEHKETPGLGSKMDTPEFKNQFTGKNLSNTKFQVTKDGGDIDAITSATITSRAVCEGVDLGLKVLNSAFGGETVNEDMPEELEPAEPAAPEEAAAPAEPAEETGGEE